MAEPAPEVPVAPGDPPAPAAPDPPAPAAPEPPLPAAAAPPPAPTPVVPVAPPPPPPPHLGEPRPSPVDQAQTLVAARPEAGVGAAFAGGLLFAMILKRLAR
jgi:hypothetical protein